MSSSPIQVDGALLERLIHLGPATAEGAQDVQVYRGDANTGTGCSCSLSEPATVSPPQDIDPSTTSTSAPAFAKRPFQPQRNYCLEGRIIHKRKLSRKLFFLDVSLVRRRPVSVRKEQQPIEKEDAPESMATSAAMQPTTAEGPQIEKEVAASKEVDGFQLSEWEDLDSDHGSASGSAPQEKQQGHSQDKQDHRMEVIVRFPIHSLKGLDDLWRKVQLGSVVKVYGDIELSERNIGSEETNSPQQQQHRWSALLHCLDFDVVELWQGKEAFEPNPGTSSMQESSRNKRRVQNQNGGLKDQRKRKSGEMEDGSEQVSGSGEKKQERGDESQPHCKFWLNSGKCNKELCLFWHETDPAKLKVERRQWVEERVQAKRQISHHASDPHQKTTKNQHRERALYFAHWLIKTFTRDFLNSGAGVLDIAGGRGDLSWELQTRQGIRSTIVEPRPGKGMRKWQRKWLQKFMADNNRAVSPASASALAIMVETEEGVAPEMTNVEDAEGQEPDGGNDFEGLGDFIPTTLTYALQATESARMQAMLDDQFLINQQDLVGKASIMIGLHPDQATEPIVRAALKVGKPFAIIPCCVFGRDNPHRRLPRAPADFADKEHGTSAKEDVDGEDNLSTRPVTSYDDFVTWLSTLHPEIETTWLNFEGMNRVLFWRGPLLSDEV